LFTSAPEKNFRLRPILSTTDSECLLTVHLSTSLQEGRPLNTSTRVLAVTAAASSLDAHPSELPSLLRHSYSVSSLTTTTRWCTGTISVVPDRIIQEPKT